MARSTWGSVRQKSKGVWEIRYPKSVSLETGARKQVSEYVRGTKKLAEQRLAELRVKYGSDSSFRHTGVTVARGWGRYYEPFIKGHLAPSTVQGYKSAFKTRIEPAFGEREVESITPIEVQEWLDSMSYGAAQKNFAAIRAFFNYMEDKDIIEKNVMRKRYLLPKKATPIRKVNDEVHSLETLQAIFEECKGEFWEAGYIFSAFGGLRKSEAFGAQWSDIEWVEGGVVVNIKRGVQLIDRKVVETDLKTEESEAAIFIPDPYAARLKEIATEREGDLWVFDDGFGNPSNPDTVSKTYQRWYQYHPYIYIPWKNLRKSYGTVLHEAGVDLGMIAKMLRHTTPLISFKNYDRPSIEAFANNAKRIGES